MRRGKIAPAAAAAGIGYDSAYHELEDLGAALSWLAEAVAVAPEPGAGAAPPAAPEARAHATLASALQGLSRRVNLLLGHGDNRKKF